MKQLYNEKLWGLRIAVDVTITGSDMTFHGIETGRLVEQQFCSTSHEFFYTLDKEDMNAFFEIAGIEGTEDAVVEVFGTMEGFQRIINICVENNLLFDIISI